MQSPQKTPVLELENLGIAFGGLQAVSGLNLHLEEGELAALIGPNGAGKTTVFNLITGIYVPMSGSVRFQGESINGVPPFKITQKGMARTFQNIRLFGGASVLDNVRIAYHCNVQYSALDGILRTPRFVREERELTERSQELLSIFNLQDRQNELAKNLPYGEQRRLEIARALAAKPKLLLLDEPAAGMNPNEVNRLMELIHFVRERFSLTILLIEHQMRVVMGICERITVMDFGQVIAEGTPGEIQNNPKVIEAYLGRAVA